MPSFMMLLHRPIERRPMADAESVARVTREYTEWADRTRAVGRLKAGSKLTDDAGRILRNESERQAHA
jgi:hypothetical protein